MSKEVERAFTGIVQEFYRMFKGSLKDFKEITKGL